MNHYTIFYMNAGKECQLKRTTPLEPEIKEMGFQVFCREVNKSGIFIDNRTWISPAAIMMITYEWIPA